MGNRPDDGPDFGPFMVAPGDFGAVLGLLQGGEVDSRPPAWQGLGDITIRTNGGESIDVLLFQTDDDRGAYRINRTYYRGGTDTELIRVLADCAARGR